MNKIMNPENAWLGVFFLTNNAVEKKSKFEKFIIGQF